jgi:hypothetical protein
MKIADVKTADILNLGLCEENGNLLDPRLKRSTHHSYCENLHRSTAGALCISMKRIPNPAH